MLRFSEHRHKAPLAAPACCSEAAVPLLSMLQRAAVLSSVLCCWQCAVLLSVPSRHAALCPPQQIGQPLHLRASHPAATPVSKATRNAADACQGLPAHAWARWCSALLGRSPGPPQAAPNSSHLVHTSLYVPRKCTCAETS